MSAVLQIEKTVPAYPLGQPIDGRSRFGMTPEQARIYRWLLAHRPHDGTFKLDFRDAAAGVNIHLQTVHYNVRELVARGWLYEDLKKYHTAYGFVKPVMHFKEPRDA